LGQAANTFWVNRVGASARAAAVERRRSFYRRLIDGTIIMVILAASAICVSVYFRAKSELVSAMSKQEAAEQRVSELKVQLERREREVEQLKSDRRTIELYARQRFGFVRDGDVVIRMAQEQAATGDVRMANLTPRRDGKYTESSN
jgi:cell division protein FtsB